MNPVEDMLRATARALAEAIPDDNPPPRRPAPQRNRTPSRWRRARPWLIPLAAAMAVLAAVAASLAITHGWDSHATPPAHRPSPQGLPQGVPPYYVAINLRIWHAVAVSSTATGRSLAEVDLGKTWFPQTVGTGGNDRTFVLWARTSNPNGAGRFFLLRFDPDGDRTRVAPLTVNIADGHTVEMLAISPDGKRLAVISQGADQVLTVFNLSTGAERTWYSEPLGFGQGGFLSWSSDGHTVQYGMDDVKVNQMAYGLLNTGAPGTSLPIRTIPVGRTSIGAAIMSANGTLVVAGTHSVVNSDNGTWWLAKFAAATGRPLSRPVALGGAVYGAGWISPDGNLLIINLHAGKVWGPQVMGAHLNMLVGGHSLQVIGAGAVAW